MKFQVIKCEPMVSKPNAPNAWVASMVKGLFTDDAGEIEMVEVMLFGERGAAPPTFSPGDHLMPVFGVRRNRTTNRAEFVIASFAKLPAVMKAA